MRYSKGKIFTCKKGKFKGKKVQWHYPNGKKKGRRLKRAK